MLGICYGMQLACHFLGCTVDQAESREYGRARLEVVEPGDLLGNIPNVTTVWISHGDQMHDLGEEFQILASTPTCPYAAVRHRTLPFFGVQFHPEVTHTPRGTEILRNFLFGVCGADGDWTMRSYIDEAVEKIRAQVEPDQHVICGLSGGENRGRSMTRLMVGEDSSSTMKLPSGERSLTCTAWRSMP